MSNSLMDKIKKMHSAVSIEQKDYSLKEIVNKNTPEAILEIKSLSSKFVAKYHKDGNEGYHTTIQTSDGKRTGCFSGALLEFARFFYSNAKMDTTSDFCKITFDGFIKVKVTYVPLDAGRSTYNFEILDGEIKGLELMGGGDAGGNLLLTSGQE